MRSKGPSGLFDIVEWSRRGALADNLVEQTATELGMSIAAVTAVLSAYRRLEVEAGAEVLRRLWSAAGWPEEEFEGALARRACGEQITRRSADVDRDQQVTELVWELAGRISRADP